MRVAESLRDSRFFTAGRAVFTVDNGGYKGRPRKHLTFKIVKKTLGHRARYFAFYRTQRGEGNWTYLGEVNSFKLECRPTKSSQLTLAAPEFKAINWAMGMVAVDKEPPGEAVIMHAGMCGRCGRELTDPESIRRGFGPECFKKIR